MVVALLRTTVPELVPLASALPVRVAGELPPPAPMAATHGVAPEVTGEPPLLESRVLAPTEVEWMMDPLRLTPTWVTNLTPTLTPMPATEASPTRLVAMVTPLRAAPVTDHGLMPPPEAPLTTGLDRELPRVPRATPKVLPTRSPTPTAMMPLLAATPPLRLLLASAPETRLPLLLVDTKLDVPVPTTPPAPEGMEQLPLVASEMDATVEFQATVARRPMVPMTDNTETKLPAVLP